MSDSTLPLLWHLDVSHYNEKARWALDYKAIPHRRRAPIPGVHIPLAFALTGGSSITLPILQMDGRTIHDSTAIIAALEERRPEPPLYPEDAEELRRALELEDFFDEELGPHLRLLAFHELGRDEERFIALIERTAPPLLARAAGASASYARALTAVRFGVRDEAAAQLAREKVLAALDRLESELGDDGYLVGGRFTVADLTAAALFNPLVLPDGGPLPSDEPPPEGLRRFREPIEERPGFRWVQETYRRHRRPSPPAPAAAADEAAAPTA
jgi:glutathione S-transferase